MRKIEDLEIVINNLERRNMHYDIEKMKRVIGNYFKEKIEIEIIRKERNKNSEGPIISDTMRVITADIKNKLKIKEEKFAKSTEEYEELLNSLPNIMHESVPTGKNSDENVIIHTRGEIKFVKHHYDMPIFNDISQTSGSRFVSLKGKIAQLERALISYSLNRLNKLNFEEYSFPYMLNTQTLKLTGHYRELEDMFVTTNDKALIPTGELPLLILFHNKKLTKSPLKVCTVTDCFRKEAGASGKDTKGLIRVHQFKKVEMVIACKPEESYNQLEQFTQYTEDLLASLGIPYRRVLLCSGDIGFRSAKTYDLEIPIGGVWRECASMSNCEAYQTKLLKCKYDKEFAHALNGTYIASGRVLASLLEINYHNNIIKIPKVLHSYLNFTEIDLNELI